MLSFNKAVINGASVLQGDFVSGSGSLSVKGSDKSVTTADGSIHHIRSALSKEASFEAFGDWTSLSSSCGLSVPVALYSGATLLASFNAIVSASYNSSSRTTSISLQGDSE